MMFRGNLGDAQQFPRLPELGINFGKLRPIQ
jgi:hypothetical protein